MDRPVCRGCQLRDELLAERDRRIAELERRVHDLENTMRDLLGRLSRNASNSSLPPSANPPQAPKPVVKEKTGKKSGAQRGHPPHLKQFLPAERVSRVETFVPTHCARCQAALPVRPGPGDPPPSRHQVADLPEIRALIVEYQGHTRICPCCGYPTHAAIPAEIKKHSIGPGLAATLSYLAGCHRVSQRGQEEIAEALFDVPVAVGTVANLAQEMSQALQGAHAEALEAVRAAPVKNVDETSWKMAGQRCWLWVAATQTVAAFVIHGQRGVDGLIALLGEVVSGIICSGRWSVYGRLQVLQRQVCWAHLKRDFTKLRDRGGPAGRIGRAGLEVVRQVFDAWHLFRGGGLTRRGLEGRLEPVGQRLEAVLRAGLTCTDGTAATFCANLLALLPALWRFVITEGVEPTNNHAERVLRKGVLWRKNAFGSQSAAGCRFVERLLTVTQTLRLQGRHVLTFLRDSLIAHRQGQSLPKLLRAG
jgi:transposase